MVITCNIKGLVVNVWLITPVPISETKEHVIAQLGNVQRDLIKT